MARWDTVPTSSVDLVGIEERRLVYMVRWDTVPTSVFNEDETGSFRLPAANVCPYMEHVGFLCKSLTSPVFPLPPKSSLEVVR